jgi:hypothetical protein
VRFALISLCVTSQRVFIAVSIYFVVTQSGNFWILPRVTELKNSEVYTGGSYMYVHNFVRFFGLFMRRWHLKLFSQ